MRDPDNDFEKICRTEINLMLVGAILSIVIGGFLGFAIVAAAL